MWDRIDRLLQRAPHDAALRLHRVELLEVRRRRRAGTEVGSLGDDEMTAIVRELAAMPMLQRVRDAWDGPLVLHKGAEVALDYPGPRLRRYCDLDLLTDDAPRAQAALLAAGFEKSREMECAGVAHHQCPLKWPGLPLTVELHSGPNWVAAIPGPTTGELIATAIPGRLGVAGVSTPAPAHHVLLLAAHAWSHEELGRLGNLIDVAVTLRRTSDAEVAALARRWGCMHLWRTTRAAVESVLEGKGRSAAVALWGRHLRDVRERSVLEWHTKNALAPVWGLPRTRVPVAVMTELWASASADEDEPWRAKLLRTRLAAREARKSRSDHLLALAAGVNHSDQEPETR